jgi:integrase-like protein
VPSKNQAEDQCRDVKNSSPSWALIHSPSVNVVIGFPCASQKGERASNEAHGGDTPKIQTASGRGGRRREEIGGMLWSEIDLDKGVWRIDAERTKNGLAHDVPLSSPPVEILRGPEKSGRALVFGSREGPFQG